MKKKVIVSITIGFIMMFSFDNLYSQNWLLGGNPALGPNGTTSISNFYGTMAANPDIVRFGTRGFNRMLMMDGFGGILAGRIAMGNNLLGTFIPQDRLHLNQTAGATFIRFTNDNIGSGFGNGFRIGNTNIGVAQFIQLQNQPMQFFIFDQNPSQNIVVRRAEFTTGGQMPPGPGGPPNNVDGFRIWNPGYPNSLAFNPTNAIDIWTGNGNSTHIRWDNSGTIEGQNNRHEFSGRLNGFWFNCSPTVTQYNNPFLGRYFFHIDSVEVMRIGTGVITPGHPTPAQNQFNILSGFVKIGLQSAGFGTDAQNRLEIDAFPTTTFTSPGLCGGPSTGLSGLRFTDLTAASIPCLTNPGLGVLAVDANGDVIYVPATPPNVSFLNCGTASSVLNTHSRFGLNAFNFYFEGQGLPNNSVLIGRNCITAPLAKLDVFQNSTANNTIGIHVENADPASNGALIGIKSITTNPTPGQCHQVAGWFEANSSVPNCNGLLAQYAIWVPDVGGVVAFGYPGLGTNPFNANVEINGNLWMTGSVNGTGYVAISDSQLKTDTASFSSGLDVIRQVNVKSYRYNGTLGLPANKKQLGVIAEDVRQIQQVAPFAVDTLKVLMNPNDIQQTDILGIRSDALFYTSINAIKQLDSTCTRMRATMDSLCAVIDSMRNQLNIRTQNPGQATTKTDVILTNKKIVLDQNSPNPFRDQTVISYEINKNFTSAMIMFTDMTGDIIKEVPITEKGKGQLNVFASDLTSGIYTYYIVVDGVTIDSKKMVKTK